MSVGARWFREKRSAVKGGKREAFGYAPLEGSMEAGAERSCARGTVRGDTLPQGCRRAGVVRGGAIFCRGMGENRIFVPISLNKSLPKPIRTMPELSVLLLFIAMFVVSMRGFRDPVFFRKYLFEVSDVKYKKEYYRLITCGFLHLDWMHLLFNAITLYFFYSIPFGVLGEVRFFVLYFVGLGLSGYFSYLIHRNDSGYAAVGASGAVSAVLFSAIVLHPKLELVIFPIPIPIPGYIFAVAYLLYTTYGMRRSWGNVGHAAHLGGAAAGVLLTLLMEPRAWHLHPLLVGLILALLVVLIVWELKRRRIL